MYAELGEQCCVTWIKFDAYRTWHRVGAVVDFAIGNTDRVLFGRVSHVSVS